MGLLRLIRGSHSKVIDSRVNIFLTFSALQTDFTTAPGRATEEIKRYGLAIALAEVLSGTWILEPDGTMRRGHEDGLPEYEAEIDLDAPTITPILARMFTRQMELMFTKKALVDEAGLHFYVGDRNFRIEYLSRDEMTVC